ncbi:MAG TPA: nucleotide exchange factor GrpE [Pyrinomonadaceae bacterium]|nr:nucleotide exchange factor GrpE [Pyrinomonadaceae bacterium]
MPSEKTKKKWNRIPIRFLDKQGSDLAPDQDVQESQNSETALDGGEDIEQTEEMALKEDNFAAETDDQEIVGDQYEDSVEGSHPSVAPEGGGPEVAELVATRAELKRVEKETGELKDRLARRQADFENFRKRIERERTETYNRAVADIASKLLPVLDNLRRALDTEASVESTESDEFRHFLSGVDLIYKQLDGVIDALGVKPVPAVGEPFNPHFHEAVVTEATDEYEPDTIVQEIVRGYRMGDKLIRPSLVKVAVKK